MYKRDTPSARVGASYPKTIPAITVLDTPDLPTIQQPALVLRDRHSIVQEWIVVGLLLSLAFLARLYAAFHAGLEVDEPIYRYAAAYAAQYGFPAVRAEATRHTIPFLYHPPFFLWLLGVWFMLWGNNAYLTGRVFSILCSVVMLGLLYAFIRRCIGWRAALLTLLFVGGDTWIIFTNQAIYLENSQILFIILGMWAYWRASQANSADFRQYALRYLLAGICIGWVVVYKQIGGFLLIGVAANLLMQRKHWLGHLFLCAAACGALAVYAYSMHAAFGSLFDSATLTQLRRTLGARQSAGLTYSPLTALEAIGSRYFIFPLTILTLVGGSLLVTARFALHLLGKRKEDHPVLLGWAFGGVVFAVSISLKSPHYMILWLVPLYIFLGKEFSRLFAVRTAKQWKYLRGIVLAGFIIVNLWSFQARFMNLPGDTLAQAGAYINANLPSNAVVLTEDYIGVDIIPQYRNINLENTPAKVFKSGVTYAALYWSTTEPLPASLGKINQYCIPLKTFSGFKDNVEVCRIDRSVLASMLIPRVPHKNPHEQPQKR